MIKIKSKKDYNEYAEVVSELIAEKPNPLTHKAKADSIDSIMHALREYLNKNFKEGVTKCHCNTGLAKKENFNIYQGYICDACFDRLPEYED